MEGVPWGAVFDNGGAVALIIIIGFFVISGKLRPDKAVQEIREDRETRVKEIRTEAEQWRTAYFKSEEARNELQQSVDTLIELARTSEAVLNAINNNRAYRGDSNV
jgi:hypothetical protein